MNPQEQIDSLESTGNYRVIQKLPSQTEYNSADDSAKLIGAILDVETTGLDKEKDLIIELGMILFEFNREGKIFKIIAKHDFFEDPGTPIPAEITALTGITDADVKNQKIDDQEVAKIVSNVALVIAHNASFDRAFCEKRLPIFKDLYWACTYSQVPWREEGVAGSKQEYIAYHYRFFYEGHRAVIDCQALLHILSKDLPTSKTPVLKSLLTNARKTTYKIAAVAAPFDKKDDLKKRGYHWDPTNKYWHTEVYEESREEELEYLQTNIYTKPISSLPQTKITGLNRWSQ